MALLLRILEWLRRVGHCKDLQEEVRLEERVAPQIAFMVRTEVVQ